MLSRNVVILSLCQALASSGASLVVFTGGLVGAELAPSPEWATLSVAAMVVGTALFTIPASLLMRRFGRRPGMISAAILAALAAGGSAYAIAIHQFFLFCGAILLIGGNLAFVQQYRFAAAESMPTNPGRAVSFVLLGGMAAGILGPEIGKRTRVWLAGGEYVGSFASLVFLYLLVAILLSFLATPPVKRETYSGGERPLRKVIAQPDFLVAVLAGIVAYGVMSFIMTATPVSMHRMDGYSIESTGWVIQSHVIAMYLPSLFTGIILARLGTHKVMGLGALSMAGSVILTLLGRGLPNYWIALVLLGLGWNFLFVGGTILLIHSYHPVERFKAQAVNDFMIFSIQALASLSAGEVLFRMGWNTLVAMTLPVLLGVLIALYLIGRFKAARVVRPVAPAAD